MKALAGAVVVMGMAAQAGAAGLLPGQWRSDYRVLINGRDSTAVMSQFVAQVRSALPTSVKTNARVGLNSIGNLGSSSVCLPAQVASTLTTPTTIFNTFSKMNPLCKLVAGTPNGGTVPFTGRCDDPVSFTGPVSGQVSITSSAKWAATMEGAGKFPDAVLAGLSIPAKTTVMMKTTASNNLLSTTCQ
ncbi:hypothetical protein [Aquabacterium sp.]|uniref:hypothetical protein n=1 Tax=Aquabacterium sp. TaxID=1872578 RepID=UPI003D6D0AF3